MLRHDDVIICHLILTGYQKQSLNQQASLAQWHQHKAIIHQIEYKDWFKKKKTLPILHIYAYVHSLGFIILNKHSLTKKLCVPC